MNYQEFFRGKKITLLGLGLLGRGVGDARFLAECGAIVTVTDKKNEHELAASVQALKDLPVIFHLGEHHTQDFTDADIVIKAAGVRLDSPEIAAARKAKVPVYMSTALFTQFAFEIGARVVGVTGTRGKTTIAHMLYHSMQQAGRRSYLGGNVRGISTLATLPLVKKDDVIVLELDSWQLQGFGDLKISPHIAVFSNLMSDHQNYYPDTETYFDDKANIFKYQKAGNTFIAGQGVVERIRAARPPIAPLVPPPLPVDWTLKIPGVHNRENASLATATLSALGLREDDIKSALESFGGVEGRLQFVHEINGVKIYNDNNSTTSEATIAAIKALDTRKKNIILIMGGSDKGLDMSELWKVILETGTDIYFLAGTGIDKIRPQAPHVPQFDTLKGAVDAALAAAKPGDVLLFSPAFASFGMFKNEYDRNDQFLALIESKKRGV